MLQERVRRHGRSPEEEVREILRSAVTSPPGPPGAEAPLGQRLRALSEGIGLDNDIPEWRGSPANPVDLA